MYKLHLFNNVIILGETMKIDTGERAMRELPKYRPSRMLLAVMFVLTAVMIVTSNTHAGQNTPPPTDKSISMPLTQHYANKSYDYTCNPTLESQKKFKLTSFSGSMNIPEQQKEIPPANLTIKIQDPPST